MKEKYITIKEAIKLLNVSRSTLWHWDKTNYLKAYHIGKSVVYKTNDIDIVASCELSGEMMDLLNKLGWLEYKKEEYEINQIGQKVAKYHYEINFLNKN